MTDKEAIQILSMELSHTESHMEIEGKATEYYKEMSQIAEALRIGIDAIRNSPIIRCPDCKYYHPFKHWCDVHEDWAGGENGYCSLAKRKVEVEE